MVTEVNLAYFENLDKKEINHCKGERILRLFQFKLDEENYQIVRCDRKVPNKLDEYDTWIHQGTDVVHVVQGWDYVSELTEYESKEFLDINIADEYQDNEIKARQIKNKQKEIDMLTREIKRIEESM